MQSRNEPLAISALLRFEFLHGIRREVFRNAHDRATGLSLSVAMGAITAFEEDLRLGRLFLVELDLFALTARAEALSAGYATAKGTRAFDTLHVATALSLGFSELLTFDQQQRDLAMAEGLVVPC
jgi:predicted nucleic acid-binding protein